MAKPTEEGKGRLKRVLRYLRGKPVCEWRFEWQRRQTHLVGYTDSDWAGCPKTRRSTSGGGIMRGSHLLTHWSRCQSCVALSSGEAELNAMLKAACEGLSLQYLLGELGEDMMLHLRGDSSASHGTLQRLGSGRIKHLQTRQLWLQEKVYAGEVSVEKIGRAENWADSLTHPWVALDERHFESMGVRSVGGSMSRTQG